MLLGMGQAEHTCWELPEPTLLEGKGRGAWVAQSVEHLTLGFGSGHDFTVRGFEP